MGGTIAVINCDIHGCNASAVSCSAVLTLAYTTIGGSNASTDGVYNGVENLCLAGQSTTIDSGAACFAVAPQFPDRG